MAPPGGINKPKTVRNPVFPSVSRLEPRAHSGNNNESDRGVFVRSSDVKVLFTPPYSYSNESVL